MSDFPSPDSLASMVNSVTMTMMNIKFSLAAAPTLDDAYRRAVLPIPGKTSVSVVVSSNEASCHKLGAALFSVPAADVDIGMIEDTLRELANITAGQVKRAMALDQALGLPKIISGDETWASAINGKQQVVLRAEGVDLEVQITTHP